MMTALFDVQKIGQNAIAAILNYAGGFRVFGAALSRLGALGRHPVRQVLYRQIYFTGIEAAWKISVIGAVLGIVIITQVANIAGMDPVLIGNVLVWTVVREFGPLFSAIVIIARSSPAVAAELGTMKVIGEVDTIRVMGIDPWDYLVVPRVVGMTISMVILTFYFQVASIFGGLTLASLFMDVPFINQFNNILAALGLFDVGVSLLKSLVFGLVVSCSACFHGLNVQSSVTEIPRATTQAVMQSLIFVFIFDGVITVVSFL